MIPNKCVNNCKKMENFKFYNVILHIMGERVKDISIIIKQIEKNFPITLKIFCTNNQLI